MSAVAEGAVGSAAADQRRWTFGAVEFDERTFELRVSGDPVELEPKPLEVLLHLLRHAGEIVTKDELMAAVWPGRILTDNSLPKSISRIRDVIGDEAQAVIKTVHGYGYRLVAPVTVHAAKATPALTRLDLKPGDHPPLRPQWSLVEKLGGGGQGEVWLVRHDKTREQRVFKFALDVAGLAAIKREITLYRFLRETLEGRDEFTRVLDWNLEEAPYYIELEHGAGGNLEEWAESVGGLADVPLATRLELVARIAEALAAAHSVGVLHKDLKPSNVLVLSSPIPREAGEQLRIKLTDFGSGGVLDPKRLEALGITRLGFTQSVMTGEAAATAMYLAPEVMSGQPATVQADIYALGILLYQMVVGDLKHPLAPGWEQRVNDEVLGEDIAAAVAGEPARRLADASSLATRLRTLEERRRQRVAEEAEKLRLGQEQQAAEERARKAELAVERLRTRRAWQRTVLAILIVAVSISLGLYLQARQARNDAAAAAESSQAVADFLSKDMFAQVDSRPLRSLTVKDMLDAASATLARRTGIAPAVGAQVNAALGNAFFALEAYAEAERHLQQALTLYEQDGGGVGDAVATAGQLVTAKAILGARPDALQDFTRYLQLGEARLGRADPAVLNLRHSLAAAQLRAGRFAAAAAAFARLVADARSAAQPDWRLVAEAEKSAGFSLRNLGEFAAAHDVLRDALASLERVGGAPPALAVETHDQLARVLVELERFREAEAELEAALGLSRAWLVDQSWFEWSVRMHRGVLELRRARTPAAIGVLEDLVRDVAASAGTVDGTAEPRRWLALAYLQAGRLDDAEAAIRTARAVAHRTFGPSHAWSQIAQIDLGNILQRRGKLDEARNALAAVDRSTLAELGRDHPFAAELRRVEGLIALAQGQREAAGAALGEAARMLERRYGPSHALVRSARADLARAAAPDGAGR